MPTSDFRNRRRFDRATVIAIAVGLGAMMAVVGLALVGLRDQPPAEQTNAGTEQRTNPPQNPHAAAPERTTADRQQKARVAEVAADDPGGKPAPQSRGDSADTASSRRGPRTGVVEIADDGQILWVSPTFGKPLDLRYLPPGAQLFLALRPAEI